METDEYYISALSLTLWVVGTCTLPLLIKVSTVKRYANETPYIDSKLLLSDQAECIVREYQKIENVMSLFLR